ESLGRAVDGGCQAGGPCTDDHRVVGPPARLRRDVEELGHPPNLRSHGSPAVHPANGREVTLGRQRAGPLLCIGENVRLESSEPNLVALEEAPRASKSSSSIRNTRVVSVARNPPGWSGPNAIAISAKTSPGFRSPITPSTPSTSLSTSIRRSSTPNSARASPSCTATSPGA